MFPGHRNLNYALLGVLLFCCGYARSLKCFQGASKAVYEATKTADFNTDPTSQDCDNIGTAPPTQCFTISPKDTSGRQTLSYGCGNCTQSHATTVLGKDTFKDVDCEACKGDDCNAIGKIATIKGYPKCNVGTNGTEVEVHCKAADECAKTTYKVNAADTSDTEVKFCQTDCMTKVVGEKKKKMDDSPAACSCGAAFATACKSSAAATAQTPTTPSSGSGSGSGGGSGSKNSSSVPKTGQMAAGGGGSPVAMALTLAAFVFILRL